MTTTDQRAETAEERAVGEAVAVEIARLKAQQKQAG
jgi:hypothetical protein